MHFFRCKTYRITAGNDVTEYREIVSINLSQISSIEVMRRGGLWRVVMSSGDDYIITEKDLENLEKQLTFVGGSLG